MENPLLPSSTVPLLLGISTHLFIFIRGEWHLQVPHILFGHLSAFSLLCIIFTRDNDW
jgi:hypothetical protein